MQKVHGAQIYELSILPRTLERVTLLLFWLKSRWFALCPVSSPCRSHGRRALRAMYAYDDRPTPDAVEWTSKDWAPWKFQSGRESQDDDAGDRENIEELLDDLTNNTKNKRKMKET